MAKKLIYYRFEDESYKDEAFVEDAANNNKPYKIIILKSLTYNNCQMALKKLHANHTYGDKANEGEGWLIKSYIKRNRCNTDIMDVAAKVALIDVSNSTNLHLHKANANLVSISNKILSSDFDNRILKGDLSLVNDIAANGNISLFSFATKYCHYHNKEKYMKYDNIIGKILPYYIEKYGIKTPENISCKRIRNYTIYSSIINELCKVAQIDQCDNKYELLDAFLWYSNKEQQN